MLDRSGRVKIIRPTKVLYIYPYILGWGEEKKFTKQVLIEAQKNNVECFPVGKLRMSC
jgi:hypothetical protein